MKYNWGEVETKYPGTFIHKNFTRCTIIPQATSRLIQLHCWFLRKSYKASQLQTMLHFEHWRLRPHRPLWLYLLHSKRIFHANYISISSSLEFYFKLNSNAVYVKHPTPITQTMGLHFCMIESAYSNDDVHHLYLHIHNAFLIFLDLNFTP